MQGWIMKNSIDLAEFEKKTFKSVHEDGLWDIMIGLTLIIFMVLPLYLSDAGLSDFWSSFVMLIPYALIFLIIKTFRSKLVGPRIGIFKIGQSRRKKIRILNLFLVILLVLGAIFSLLAFDLVIPVDNQAWFFPLIISSVFLFMFSAAAFLLSAPRFLIYGTMIAFFVPAGEILFRKGILMHHGFPAAFGTAALIIILTGIIKLVLFLKRYPKSAMEDSDDDIRS
jgi:hypothetical protein